MNATMTTPAMFMPGFAVAAGGLPSHTGVSGIMETLLGTSPLPTTFYTSNASGSGAAGSGAGIGVPAGPGASPPPNRFKISVGSILRPLGHVGVFLGTFHFFKASPFWTFENMLAVAVPALVGGLLIGSGQMLTHHEPAVKADCLRSMWKWAISEGAPISVITAVLKFFIDSRVP